MHRPLIALLGLLVVVPAAAQSEPLPLELVWKAPAGCPSAADVRSELARIARVRLGYSLRPLAAEAHVVRAAEGFRVVLHTEHEERRGERTLEANDCPTLVRSITLVLALAFGPAVELAPDRPQPTAAARAQPSSRPQAPSPERANAPADRGDNARDQASASPARERAPAGRDDAPQREAASSAASERAPAARDDGPARDLQTPERTAAARGDAPSRAADTSAAAARERAADSRGLAFSARDGELSAGDDVSADSADAFGLAVFVNVSGALGLLPKAALGGSAGVRLSVGEYALDARAVLVPSASFELSSAIRAHFRALGGSLSACRSAPLASVFELSACAGGRVVALAARTSGALAPERATAPWTALTALGSLDWPRRSWLQLRIELAIAISLSRPRFVVESLGDVHRVALFVPELGLGALVAF